MPINSNLIQIFEDILVQPEINIIINPINFNNNYVIETGWLDVVKKDFLENNLKNKQGDFVINISLLNYEYNKVIKASYNLFNEKLTFEYIDAMVKKLLLYLRKR